MPRLLVVSLALLLGFGCDSNSSGLMGGVSTLSGTDCKPRKLTKMQTCTGEDHSFQECGFFFRASGVPDRSWCEALAAQAQGSSPSPACDWNNPAAWRPVACATYNVHGAARCFSCADAQPEAGKTYVYAYDANCSRGIEQVTCNVDPIQAGVKLGPASF